MACELRDGIGPQFCSEELGPTSRTSTTTWLLATTKQPPVSSSSCSGVRAEPVGTHAIGTDCSKLMREGATCSAICTAGNEVLGAFRCSLGRLLDASYCIGPSTEVRTSFRLKVAFSFSLHLNASPSVAALRRSLAAALETTEYLLHRISWYSTAGRRLGEPRLHTVNAGSHQGVQRESHIFIDVEVIVAKNETASIMESRIARLFLDDSAAQEAFKSSLQHSFNLTVNHLEMAVPARSFQSLVVSSGNGTILEIPGSQHVLADDISQSSEELGVGALVGGIVGVVVAMLAALTFTYCMRKRNQLAT